MRTNVAIVNMYRAKDKFAFFAIHQALNKFNNVDLQFHIIWDDTNHYDEWSSKLDSLECKLISYTKEFIEEYAVSLGIPIDKVRKFKNFKLIYGVVLSHYLNKNKIIEYCVKYDDDIVIKDDIQELLFCFENKIPCLITEPMNAGCDKVLLNKILSMYDGAYERYVDFNPKFLGFNAGFIAYDLDIFSDFNEKDTFEQMIDLFNLEGIYDEHGEEIWGPERTMIDLQEQSFLSIMNQIRSRKIPHILNPSEYFTCPNWGTHPIFGEINTKSENEGWDINMKSKIIHFIGHTIVKGIYYGKSKVYYKLVDEYLNKQNIMNH